MSQSEPTLQEQIDDIDSIIASNVNNVASKGTRIQYNSIDDALKAKQFLDRKANPTKSYRTFTNACHSKGL